MFKSFLVVLSVLLAYLLLMPVEVKPVAWQAPSNPGYNGDFSPNQVLADLHSMPIGEGYGPEDVVQGVDGYLYVSMHQGQIVRISPQGDAQVWVETGGRPLGLAVDAQGNVIVADAYQGLLLIAPDGKLKVLTDSVNGQPILYANNLDIADDGKIYFSDSSTRYGAKEYGGSYPASLLDLMEHGHHGRVLVYDPENQTTSVVVKGLNFPNGIAMSHDNNAILINETGNYRVLKFHLKGNQKGLLEALLSSLPAFPDNLTRGLNGRYWLGLVSPRNPMLDAISDKPFLRKMVQRLPGFIRPKAQCYSHVIAIDDAGNVVSNLQDPEAAYAINTSVLETPEYLYIGSLMEDTLGRLPNPFASQFK